MAYQDTSLILAQPVKNNLYLAAPSDHRPHFWRRKRWARRVLAEFDLDLELFPDAPAGFLTLADRQLFEVAKALVTDPKVLLLDEPTTALGPTEVEALHRTVAACRERGVGVVYVSHRLPEVLEVADRITVLRDGRSQGTFDARDTTESALVELIVGRPFEAAFPPASPDGGEPREVLLVDGLQGQSFGPVSFTMQRGEIVGVAGAEGNGQPELFDCLAGRQPPRAGRVDCDGKELMLTSTHEAVRSGIMLLPGDRKREALMPVLGVRVNATVQTLRRFSVMGMLRRGRERRDGAGTGRATRDPHAVARAAGAVPVRWEPAEGGRRAIVPQGADRHPRVRADPGRRRRLPLRHLRGVALTDRRRSRAPGQVERPARARRSVRPGAGDVPRPDHRGDPRRGAGRASHRRGHRARTRPLQGRAFAVRDGDAEERFLARRDVTTTRLDSGRLAIRKVIRDARDKNKWRKIVRFRLWMPVVLQLLLIVAVAVYTTSRFPGFINHANVTNILLLAAPLALVAIGQTHALLVGYLDLSVGAMVTLGVVIASFVIGPDSSTAHVALGVGVIFLAGLTLGLVNAGLVRGLEDPVDHRHPGHPQHPQRDLAHACGTRPAGSSIATSRRGWRKGSGRSPSRSSSS